MKPGREKVDVDLDELLGGGSKSKGPPADMGDEEPDGDEGEDALPPGFTAAGEEFLDATLPNEERLAALHRAIKACGGGEY